ncbi:unnamed protein product [Peniophora sp. CBMAI 1063]|nr:unnamed protein product [Peniophora sp. CBMAI 1063]
MASTAETHFLQFAIQWASLALLYYDYALTFPREVRYIWRGKKRVILVILYVLCRYALLANVLYLLAISHHLGDDETCDVVYKVVGAVSVLGRAAIIFTMLIRAYVVCAKNRIILFSLLAIALTCFILDILHVPGLQCEAPDPMKIVTPLLSIMVCVFEFLVTTITVFQSVLILRQFGSFPVSMNRETLSYLVAEQGILYFTLISIFTIGGTVLNFRAPAAFFQRLLNAITLPLSGMLTARFILRLRAYYTMSPEWARNHPISVCAKGC